MHNLCKLIRNLTLVLACPSVVFAADATNLDVTKVGPPTGLSLPYLSLAEKDSIATIMIYETFTAVLHPTDTDKVVVLPGLLPCHAIMLKNMNTGIVIVHHYYFTDKLYQINFQKYFEYIKTVIGYEEGHQIDFKVYCNINEKNFEYQSSELTNLVLNIVQAFGENNLIPFKHEKFNPLYCHKLKNVISRSYPLAEYCVAVDCEGNMYNTCLFAENKFKQLISDNLDENIRYLKSVYIINNFGDEISFFYLLKNQFLNLGYFQAGIIICSSLN